MKLIFFLKILCLMSISILYANENEIKNKIYVELNQLTFDENGIAVSLSDKELKLSTLYRDNKGFYFLDDYVYGDCPCGHPAVTSYGECDVPNCPYYYSRRED